MKLLDLTLDSPAANIALDEALLEHAESASERTEILRLWEPMQTIVVVGRSSSVEQEVDLEFCQQQNIAIQRRCSGGASIVTGPGCLMYAVLLDYHRRPSLRMLEQAHQFVLQQIQQAIEATGIETQILGTSDLAIGNRKFSGNSMRSKRSWMLYHGTLLCDSDLSLISRCLKTPPRQPDYRQGRSHQDFLTQLPVPRSTLKQAIIEQWSAVEPVADWPETLTHQLEQEKYLTEIWTHHRKVASSRLR